MPRGAGEWSLQELIPRIRLEFDSLQAPASGADIVHLQSELGPLPASVCSLYLDHDGATALRRGFAAPARLMPIAEAVTCSSELETCYQWVSCGLGRISWLWTDDNSNYVGIYRSGPLRNWLVKLNHNEPVFTPAYRTVEAWLQRLLERPPDCADLVGVPCEIPVIFDEDRYERSDRELSQLMLQMAKSSVSQDLKRLLQMCGLALLPVKDASVALSLLDVDDMWVPAAAANLLGLRDFKGGVPELVRLAKDGSPNGDSAAMRLLVRMNSNESQKALKRLRAELTGSKQKVLAMWHRLNGGLDSLQWP